ncbi:MAG: TRAP transporter small permease [Desulfobacterales bacterium]|nr:TRAP transporter small permease [Desulfobacterales bacterium]
MKVPFFEKTVTRLGTIFNLIACASLFAMILLTCLDVSMRYFFSRPIIGTYDLVSLMGAVLASFALPYTMLQKGHVAVEILLQSLSKGKQLVIETATHAVGIVLFLVLVWQCILLALDMKAAGEVTPTLLLPFYPIVYCMAVCFFALCLAILLNLLHIWLKETRQ